MNRKNVYWSLLTILVLIIFISGCTPLIEKKNNVSQADQKIISGLKSRLNSNVINYDASYKRDHEVHHWGGHSGSTDYTEESNISIEVSNGQVTDYTIRHTQDSSYPDLKKDYYRYYDLSQNKLCQEEVVSESECEPITLNQPNLGGVLNGCKMSFSPNGRGECVCEGNSHPIEELPGFACSEDKNTDNMESEYGHAIYYPETKKSFCYYETRDKASEELWAFECNQENIELKPLVRNNLKPLTEVRCYQYVDYCYCKFDPVKTLVCSDDKPNNFDADTKRKIIDYLKDVTISSISEEDNEKGHCYSFSYDELDHNFCFDADGLITLAQWGRDLRPEGSTSVDINKIEKI